MNLSEIVEKSGDKGWVLEYSPGQKAFHLERTGMAVLNNIRNMLDDRHTDYGIVGLFSREEDAREAFRTLSLYRDELLKKVS